MPYHDLHIPYTGPTQRAELSTTLAFAVELGYSVAAVSVAVSGKLPPTTPVVPVASFNAPANLKVLTRLTLTISDTSQNHRLSALQSQYDLIALRPTNEKSFQLCCSSLECDLISLDLSQRLPFILKFKTVSAALQRGIRFEICYGVGFNAGSDARRNVISGATALIRATRGKGLILSSEAKDALSLRGPHDVINLTQIWGLSQEKGKEGVCEEAGRVVTLAKLKRETYRGVVTTVKEVASATATSENEVITTEVIDVGGNLATVSHTTNGIKRKASASSLTPTSQASNGAPMSKREQKRQAKKARLEARHSTNGEAKDGPKNINTFPIKHESMNVPTKGKG